MVSRRAFIKLAAISSAIVLSEKSRLFTEEKGTGICIVSFGERKNLAHVISLNTGNIIYEFKNFQVSHAVVVDELTNRFFLHGQDIETNKASIACFEADIQKDNVKLIDKKLLDGGKILHWQPNSENTKIQYNTIEDGKIHILDTKSLELKSFDGGGSHSNMAWAKNDSLIVVSDKMKEITNVNVINVKTGALLSTTKTSSWGHGLTTCEKSEMAYIWSYEGVHKISLKDKNIGKHCGIIKPIEKDVRSWFCWTPQGGRFSHDQSWGEGDVYKPYLTVLDMENENLFKIETPGQELGALQISPDGLWGAAGSHNTDDIQIFNIPENKFVTSIKAGKSNNSFFDRDLAFSKDRKKLFVTNTQDNSISMINIADKNILKTFQLPYRPSWMKVLT
jgi:DNA-binding beta-propeller fold protein YncE